ncbi:MAG: AAA family ATPase [Solirubrobacteraceae bacterium]
MSGLRDRRGRAERGSAGLLERDATLRAIDAVLGATTASSPSAPAGARELRRGLVIEGHAGMGKTRLHEAALDAARAAGMRAVRAAGAELERNRAFGVAGQLLGSLLNDFPDAARAELLAHAPPRVRILAGLASDPSSDDPSGDLALSHGLYTLLATAPCQRPTLITIDDLHWCDSDSLEFVGYLLHRLDELPFALVMTRRPGVGEEAAEILDHIVAHPRVRVEALSPLGPGAVAVLTRDAIGPRADATLIDVCRRVTAGNPFYLRELLLALAQEPRMSSDALTEHARSLAPDAVTRALRVRVGRLSSDAGALARAVAILGDDVPLRLAAQLAGLTTPRAASAADALAAVEVLLAREPLRFVHPLVRHAIERDVPASQRASRHLDAARLLDADLADTEQVAAHLLLGRAQDDPWVVSKLRAAARAARSRGSAAPAVRYLERALEEPPRGDARAAVLAELGAAETAVGLPAGAAHLGAALEATSDPLGRAQLALLRGRALDGQGRHADAASAYDAGVRDLGGERADPAALELADVLHTGFFASALIVPALHERVGQRPAATVERTLSGPLRHGQRLALARAAARATLTGQPADTVRELARRAWDEGRLLAGESSEGVGWRLLSAALAIAGEPERAIELAGAALEDAGRRNSPLASATASYWRSVARLLQGNVTGALEDLELARDARRLGWHQHRRGAAAIYARCLIETGELAGAELELDADGPLAAPRDLEDAMRLAARAELRLAQRRPQEALHDALAAGRALGPAVRMSSLVPWRTTAAQAALLAGDGPQALELARADVELAQRSSAVCAQVRALRVLGLCEPPPSGLRSLTRAVELGRTRPERLETTRALLSLGSALRRANERAAAREPLTVAADRAKRGGAIMLYERARTELAASGARPRRTLLLSGPQSLTPSERRIAELAASGHSNRDIARALFVTPKTVEYHLRNAYRKLDIETRHELSDALAS